MQHYIKFELEHMRLGLSAFQYPLTDTEQGE